MFRVNRREFMKRLGGVAGLAALARAGLTQTREVITRRIPATGEQLAAIGMGSWLTFDVGENSRARAGLRTVLEAFFDHGGALIDSSPMYGSSERVIGDLLRQVSGKEALFAATKVWTPGRWLGIKQMQRSQELWGVERFDLMQIHNLLDWETHLETLKTWKAEGRVRYIGVTTSHGRRHEEMEQAMLREPFDFVQFTYNVVDRDAEQRLLPLAQERGMAVIINRPFQRGALFERADGQPLPPWAVEFDCDSWAQFFLKFIISHPGVTCAIPATSKPDHMVQNMGASVGRLPDAAMRQRMIEYFTAL